MADSSKSLGYSIFGKDAGAEALFKKLSRAVDDFGRSIDKLDKKIAQPTIDVDTKKAEAKVGAFARDLQSKIERAVRSLPDIKLNADSSPVDRRIAEIRRELATLSSKRIGVDIDAGQAQSQINRLSAELARLGARSANVQVRADTAAASAALLGVSSLARRIDGQNVAISVNASDVSRAISLLGLLTAALAGASALVAPAAAGLAALGPVAGTAAQGIGALAVGFSGVGDAVKALGDAETKAAAGTAVSAAQRVNSAQAIASAQRQVERATEAAARAAVTGGQQIRDADRAVTAAEQDLTRAQKAARTAQEDLTRARAEAKEEIEDLGRSLRGSALDEEEAQLRLAEAQAALAKGRAEGVSGADLQRLDLDARRAALSLEEATDRHGDLREQADRAARTGVEGSERVVAAQQRATEAAATVAESEAKLGQAREQADRARQQALWAQQDAARQVTEANIALQNALADTGTQGAAAANKVKEAMEGLSPEAEKFARFLVSEVIPGLHGIRDAVQATLLPRMETALRTIGGLAPVVSAGLAETGRVIGDLSVKGAQMMTSGPWRRDFATIMASNNRVLGSFGEALLSIVDAFRSISVAAGPMVERFARFTENATQAFDSFVTGKRATGELDQFFQQMGDTLAELGHIAGQIITSFLQISQAMGPFGMVLLKTVGDLAELIGNLAVANPLLTQFGAAALVGVAAFNAIGKAVAGASLAAGVATGGWRTLLDTFGKLSPSAIAATGPMQKVAAGLTAAELAAGRYTDRLSTSTAAQERFNTSGARLGGAVTRIASALPVAGLAVAGLALAWDGLTLSAAEAADAMAQGGAAAQEATTKIAAQGAAADAVANSSLPPLVRGIFSMVDGLDEATAKARQNYDALTPLGQAQSDAATAAFRYGEAVKAHGPTSSQAAAAAGVLAAATDRVEQEQRQAEQSTLSLNDRIKQQQDLMLGATNAEIGYLNSLQALTDGLAQNGTSFDINTAAGRANLGNLTAVIEASGRFRQSLIDQGHSEGFATQKAWEHRDALINTLTQMGMTRDAAQALIDKYMKVPPRIYTKADLDMTEATDRLNSWFDSFSGRRLRVVADMVTPQGVPIRQLGGGAVGAVVDPMARGGIRSMSNRVAQVVPPNTPRLIGDRVRGREYFLPDDSAPRTMAIGAQWAHDRGLRLMPMAGGGALGSAPTAAALGAGTGGNGDLFRPLTESAEELAKMGLQPLAKELTDTTVPALELVQQHAETDTPDALRVLTQTTTASGAQIQATWARNTAAVAAAQQQQTVQQQTLATNQGAATARMTAALAGMQARHNASWADMRARSGAEVGTITGPIFGGLHRGMDLVQGHSTNMANWVGGQFGRIRGLTADPIRWSLDFPINRGLVPAWGAIDRFFALGRPMGPVPVGFAHGTEDHRAVIARPGQMRVWNEPETGGEAYIPLSQRKRHRSTEILGAVADEFGYALEPKYFADGGLWRQMWGIVKGQFPSATLNSAYRPGDPGYHGQGKATDLGGPMMAINRWIAGRFPASAQLIYTPGINLFRGRPHAYNAATRADHFDHVHWGADNAAQLGAQGAAAAMGYADIGAMVEPYFRDTRRMVADIHRFHGPGNVPAAMTRFGNDAVAGASRKAEELMATAVGPGAGAGVQRWRPVGLRALAIAGQPASHWPRMAMQMQSESGGDPTAVNRWDVNWRKGTPSVGLMQVIGPTYRAHRHPQFDQGPYLYGTSVNPLSNILASTRYTLARYGSLAAGWQGRGYDVGGIWRSGHLGWNMSGRPERVLSPVQTESFERLVDVLNTHRGMAPLVLSAPQQSQMQGALKLAGPEISALFAGLNRSIEQALSGALRDGLVAKIVDDGRNGLFQITQRQARSMARR